MKLAVDIGNTTTTVGEIREDGDFEFIRKFPSGLPGENIKLLEYWEEKISLELNPRSVKIYLSSVVPRLTGLLKEECAPENICSLEYPWDKSPLEVELDSPETAGADRIAGASAFYSEYGPGVVVDFGTATTVEAVLPDGIYAGGVIMPGVEATFRGLFEKTAALPEIEPLKPSELKCKTTEDSLQSGIYYGLAGAVDRVVGELKNKFKLPGDCPVVATGGRGGEFMKIAESLSEYDELLVLKGLVICCGQD
ncbi:MAG: type III pantothenate kinase [bacterium]